MIFLDYLFWYFVKVPQNIFKATFNFLKFGLRYFSLPFLFKTFFSHWHKYFWQYPRGFDLGKYLEVFASNLISRIIGAILRFFLILAGFAFEILVVFGGIFVFLFWIFLPAVLIFLFIYGAKLLFTI